MTLRGWAVLAAGLLGCAHSGPAVPEIAPGPSTAVQLPESARYMPLAVGNHWTYDATLIAERSTRRVEILSFRDGSYVDNQGRELRIDREGIRDQVRYLLHEPLTPGATWTSIVAPGSAEHWKVLSAHSPCEAPAGKFPDCVQVESRTVADPRVPGRLLVNRITLAAGVGIVQVRTALEEGTKSVPQAELRLTSFEVAPVR